MPHKSHTFNGPLSGTISVSRYQKGKTNLNFTEARESEWQWHLLGRMQVCTSLQTDNHASTSPLSFLQAGCPSCRPTNSVKALKARLHNDTRTKMIACCVHTLGYRVRTFQDCVSGAKNITSQTRTVSCVLPTWPALFRMFS